jgi:hypothetical protein
MNDLSRRIVKAKVRKRENVILSQHFIHRAHAAVYISSAICQSNVTSALILVNQNALMESLLI